VLVRSENGLKALSSRLETTLFVSLGIYSKAILRATELGCEISVTAFVLRLQLKAPKVDGMVR
jgi:hypothetical protein